MYGNLKILSLFGWFSLENGCNFGEECRIDVIFYGVCHKKMPKKDSNIKFLAIAASGLL